MTRTDDYRAVLCAHADRAEWDAYLQSESHLPGPRANLELLQAAADEGSLDQFRRWLASESEYLAACGAVGLGRLIAEAQRDLLPELRGHANDARWRVREGVAMGLQRLGQCSMDALLDASREWQAGTLLERRAVVAALCEPPLLRDTKIAQDVLAILDAITDSLTSETERKSDAFKALRKALAYGWSVAVAADPALGKPRMERWLQSNDRDVVWLMRENLRKDRLKRMDAAWVAEWSRR